jgi:hypothetical protein
MARMRMPIGLLIVGVLLFLSGLIQINSSRALFLGGGAVSGFEGVIGPVTSALGYGACRWGG